MTWSGWCRYAGLRLLGASWRTQRTNLATLDRLAVSTRGPIVVFWHSKYLELLPLLAGRDAVVFTSRSARGDAIAELLVRFGYRAVQLADFGGDASLARMHGALADGSGAAIAVDGPLGPRHYVHRGAVLLAVEYDRSIVPVTVDAHPVVRLRARWDRLELPWPFARVHLSVGEPMTLPRVLKRGDLDRLCMRVHDALAALERVSRLRVMDGRP